MAKLEPLINVGYHLDSLWAALFSLSALITYQQTDTPSMSFKSLKYKPHILELEAFQQRTKFSETDLNQ